MMIYLNGAIVEMGAHISTQDRGFLLGDGVFETILTQKHRALFLPEHLARLNASCAALKINKLTSTEEISSIFDDLIAANNLDESDHVLRITITRGIGARGLAIDAAAAPTMMLTLSPMPVFPLALRWCISNYVRSSASLSVRHKSLAYGDNIMAYDEALTQGADEAIMLNEAGFVASGSRSTVFLLKDPKALRTPPIDAGALPGIVRHWVIDEANLLGINVDETPFTPDELHTGFVFFTNSLMGLKPERSQSSPSPVFFDQLSARYAQVIAR